MPGEQKDDRKTRGQLTIVLLLFGSHFLTVRSLFILKTKTKYDDTATVLAFLQ